MTERLARVALGVVSGLVLLAALAIDLPRAADGRFWSDGATYHAMAGSLAFDRDLSSGVDPPGRQHRRPQGAFSRGSGRPRDAARLLRRSSTGLAAARLLLAAACWSNALPSRALWSACDAPGRGGRAGACFPRGGV
jgi:hypothetical protein